jgi:hypothetical protein
MFSGIAEVDGAALIAPIYRIDIKVLDNGTYFGNIHDVYTTQAFLAVRQHRSTGTAVSDFMHEHFTWDSESDRGLTCGPISSPNISPSMK